MLSQSAELLARRPACQQDDVRIVVLEDSNEPLSTEGLHTTTVNDCRVLLRDHGDTVWISFKGEGSGQSAKAVDFRATQIAPIPSKKEMTRSLESGGEAEGTWLDSAASPFAVLLLTATFPGSLTGRAAPASGGSIS